MSFYSGKDGRMFIGSGTNQVAAAKVRNWSYSAAMQTLPTTTLGDKDTTSTNGLRTHSGSCSIFYYADTGGTTPNSASTLFNKLVKSNAQGQGAEAETVTLRLGIDDGTANGKYIQGECLLTNVSMSMAVGEVLSAEVTFEFVGAPREMSI